MSLDQLLRDAAPAHEPMERRAAELRPTVLAQFTDPAVAEPRPRRRYRRIGRAAIAGTAVALVGVGGLAYAGGLVPSFIADELGQVSPSAVTDVHFVASFTVDPGGKNRRFEIWRGTNADGQSCTSVYEAKGRFGPEFGGNCGPNPTDAWYDRTSESYRGTINDTPPPSTYFVYGEPTLPGVVRVRVTGARFDHAVPVDPRTGGFALAVPELSSSVRGPFATVEFLAADGTILGTRTLAEK
jgi:hypothetical protein